MAHICGFCSRCIGKVVLQPGAVPLELRDLIATNDQCCSCNERMPQIWAATAKDSAAGPFGVQHHGLIQATRGTKRS